MFSAAKGLSGGHGLIRRYLILSCLWFEGRGFQTLSEVISALGGLPISATVQNSRFICKVVHVSFVVSPMYVKQ